jgi:hypothetical protein
MCVTFERHYECITHFLCVNIFFEVRWCLFIIRCHCFLITECSYYSQLISFHQLQMDFRFEIKKIVIDVYLSITCTEHSSDYLIIYWLFFLTCLMYRSASEAQIDIIPFDNNIPSISKSRPHGRYWRDHVGYKQNIIFSEMWQEYLTSHIVLIYCGKVGNKQ